MMEADFIHPRPPRWLPPLAAAALCLLAGCATYSESVHRARMEVSTGRTEAAVGQLNEVMGVRQQREIPRELSGNHTLVLLERATLLQSLGAYELAARDMMIADQRLDWLDIAAASKVKIGKYMFSGTTVPYRSPPYERVLLNTLNMINFLALRDFEDAEVEARRFTIIEQFFANQGIETMRPDLLAFGNYMGGVAFEAAGDYPKAARYYSRAWHHGYRSDRLRRRLVELLRMTGSSGAAGLDSNALEALVEEARGGEPMSPGTYRDRWVDGELVVVVQTGMAPYKIPKRYPIGRALTIAGLAGGNMTLDPEERRRANRIAAQGLVTWVNFPKLSEYGLPPDRSASLRVDGRGVELQQAVDVERQVERAWERIRPNLMVAAVTRMLARTAIGVATQKGVEAASDGNSSGLGFLASLLVQGTMTVADRPDTRSWSMLPAHIRLRRMDLEPGTHEISVRVGGRAQSKTVEVAEFGPTIVNFSKYR